MNNDPLEMPNCKLGLRFFSVTGRFPNLATIGFCPIHTSFDNGWNVIDEEFEWFRKTSRIFGRAI